MKNTSRLHQKHQSPPQQNTSSLHYQTPVVSTIKHQSPPQNTSTTKKTSLHHQKTPVASTKKHQSSPLSNTSRLLHEIPPPCSIRMHDVKKRRLNCSTSCFRYKSLRRSYIGTIFNPLRTRGRIMQGLLTIFFIFAALG